MKLRKRNEKGRDVSMIDINKHHKMLFEYRDTYISDSDRVASSNDRIL